MNLIEALQSLKEENKIKKKGWKDGQYYFKKGGCLFIHYINGQENEANIFFGQGIFSNDQYELYKEQILDAEEKEYLENFLRPFKHKIKYISKVNGSTGHEFYIYIETTGWETIHLPLFRNVNMYKGMKLNKKYTLKDLDLLQNEKIKGGVINEI